MLYPRRSPALALLALLTLMVLTCSEAATAHVEADPATTGEWPLDPRPAVAAGFDSPDERWQRGHRGVDLSGHAGQVVRSALPGTVSFAGRVGHKSVVVVTHGPRRTTYEPVAALVTRGERVEAGSPLGRLLVEGSHCFPAACLHWGLLEGRSYLDPLQLVGGGPVRLLPLGVVQSTVPRQWRPAMWQFRRPVDALP